MWKLKNWLRLRTTNRQKILCPIDWVLIRDRKQKYTERLTISPIKMVTSELLSDESALPSSWFRNAMDGIPPTTLAYLFEVRRGLRSDVYDGIDPWLDSRSISLRLWRSQERWQSLVEQIQREQVISMLRGMKTIPPHVRVRICARSDRSLVA